MIRMACADDLCDIVALCERVKENMNAHGIFQWDEVYPNATAFEQDIAQGNLFLLIEGETLRGCVAVNGHQDAEYGGIDWQYQQEPIAVIHRLMIDPTYQGRGAARLLLAFAENEAARRGCASIRLDAFSKNERALALYRRNGYEERGTVRFRKGVFCVFEKARDGFAVAES